METKKKILLILIAFIIIIGGVVISIKGFNVSLYLREHDTLQFTFDQVFEESDIKSICDEVFGDKNYEIRTVEVFNDSVYIISEEITDEEETSLVEKLFSLYSEETIDESIDETSVTETADVVEETSGEIVETTDVVEDVDITEEASEESDYEFYHDSKVRLRDLLKPYILPTVISAIIIIICMMVRYRILKSEKVILKTLEVIGKSIVLLLLLLSIIAICRIPINTWILPLLMFCILIYIMITFEIEIRGTNEKTNK